MKQDYNQFEVACNMNKCKYEKLQENLKTLGGCKYTSIFISIDTIIRDYLMMTRDMVRDEITAEKIVSEILELCAHYKRFYKKYDKNEQIYIFLYNDMNYKYEYLANPVNEQIKDSPKLFDILRDMNTLLVQICRYIPGLYYTNLDNGSYPGAIIPYQIIKSMNNSIFTRNSKMRSVIISSNPFDYVSLFLHEEGTHEILAYRRKTDIILTYRNIYQDFIFKYKSNNTPSVSINNIYFYPRIILTQPNISRVKLDGDVLKKYRKLILDFVFKDIYTDEASFKSEIDHNVSEFEALNKEISSLIKAFDTPSIYVNKINELVLYRRMWSVDCVDFNIDELNNTFFFHDKVDFASLF